MNKINDTIHADDYRCDHCGVKLSREFIKGVYGEPENSVEQFLCMECDFMESGASDDQD